MCDRYLSLNVPEFLLQKAARQHRAVITGGRPGSSLARLVLYVSVVCRSGVDYVRWCILADPNRRRGRARKRNEAVRRYPKAKRYPAPSAVV